MTTEINGITFNETDHSCLAGDCQVAFNNIFIATRFCEVSAIELRSDYLTKLDIEIKKLDEICKISLLDFITNFYPNLDRTADDKNEILFQSLRSLIIDNLSRDYRYYQFCLKIIDDYFNPSKTDTNKSFEDFKNEILDDDFKNSELYGVLTRFK